jgi:mono/diheme cytochrome c family protein
MRTLRALEVLVFLAAGCTGKYIRPTTLEKVQPTPELLERGSYLVNTAMSCGSCHTTKVENFLSGERTDMAFAGNFVDLPHLGWKFWIPNITSDPETGIGSWTDDQIMRALRDGIGQHDNLLFPMMPFNSYQHLSDDDARAVVAYLRTAPPVKNKRPIEKNEFGFFMGFLLNRGIAHHAPTKAVPRPDRADKIKYGEYVMRLGHCWECHSTNGRGFIDKGEKGFMSGYDEADELLEPLIGKIYMRNLTPDVETGLGKYSAEQIKQALKTGHRLDGKPMAPPMSMFIPHLSGLADEDMDALVAFLKSIPAFKNKIPERELKPEFEKTLH